ncbi:MAG: transposase [Anaerolineae bacterium]|nr:transposase [Anaerolineae bacterium]
MSRQAYSTDLKDAKWPILQPLIPAPLAGGRPAIGDRREIVNAILYALRIGCQ